MNANIKLSESASLLVKVTPQMQEDYKECLRTAKIPGAAGKDCSRCQMDFGMDTCLGEMDVFTHFLETLAREKTTGENDIKDLAKSCKVNAKLPAEDI